MDFSLIFNFSAWVLPLLFAITFHEAAHAWVAYRYGDDTAKALGRVTFNPIKHIDPLGTVILPGMLLLMHSPMLFGYAKPVPVNFNRLNPMKMGIIMVAMAGPLINIVLAILSALLLHLGSENSALSWWQLNLYNSLIINSVLAIFNMTPILPLDGGRVLGALLPRDLSEKYRETERYGMYIILALLIVMPLIGINIFTDLLFVANNYLLQAILLLTGHEI